MSQSESPFEFQSVLFNGGVTLRDVDAAPEPAYFADLNLDQLVTTICRGRDRDQLAGFFYLPLQSTEAIEYRQDVLADAMRPPILEALRVFEKGMREVGYEHALLTQSRYRLQKQRCLLDEVRLYCRTIARFCEEIGEPCLASLGMRSLREHLTRLQASPEFNTLTTDAEQTLTALDSISYTLRIRQNQVRVRRYHDEADLGVEVSALFERFRERDRIPDKVRQAEPGGFNHVDAQILDHVADLFPEPFASLRAFCDTHERYRDPVVSRFSREVGFVLAWADFTERMDTAGVRLTRPRVSSGGHTRVAEGCDLALASTLTEQAGTPVTNTFCMAPHEPILVITGPNQGGKTTFARMIGQTVHLAMLGCPVAGSDAEVPLARSVHALFEREESAQSRRGKLHDDLVRTRQILAEAGPGSVVVLNELFSSTTADDAAQLARLIIDQLADRGCRIVCVTFLDELASYRPEVISMVAGVDPADPARRTFRIERRPADGRAYAMALARKYRLTRSQIMERAAS